MSTNSKTWKSEDRQLAGFLLLLTLEVEAKDGVVHHPRHQEHLLDFLRGPARREGSCDLRMLLSSFPHISGCDDEKPVEAVGVMGQHGFQARGSESKAEGGEAQIDDTRVRLATAENELTEIAVIGDQDAGLALSYGKDLLVGQSRGIVTANPAGVVTTLREPGDKTRICALVEKEVHTFVGGAVPRLCPTAVCA